jgi:hypothetical protein
MVRSFLLSYLSRKAAFNEKRFQEHYPYCWLVLETSARRGEPVAGSARVADTRQGILNQGGDWPPAGDSLCFELAVSERGTARFRIGRALGNDIEIIDDSVSREHLVLSCLSPDAWTLSPIANTSTWIESRAISPGATEPIAFGAKLKLGQAILRLEDVPSMAAKLKQRAEQDSA